MITIYIKKDDFFANGLYVDGKVIVLQGSTINPSFANYIKGINDAKRHRDDKESVNQNCEVLKDIEFSSPSTAAQFVMGQSRDGYDAWKVEDGRSLGHFLEENGLRARKRRKKD